MEKRLTLDPRPSLLQDYDLRITPVDPCFEPVHGGANETEHFNSGKSVLFAVRNKFQALRLKICVVKPMPEEFASAELTVGTGEVDLDKLFGASSSRTTFTATWTCPYRYGRFLILAQSQKECGGKDTLVVLRVRRARVSEPKEDVGRHDRAVRPGQVSADRMACCVRLSAYNQTIVMEMDPPQPPCSTNSFVFRAAEPTTCDDAEALCYWCRRIDPLDCNASSILSGSEDGCENRLGCAPCREPCSALARRDDCPPEPRAPTRSSSAAESAAAMVSHRLRPTAVAVPGALWFEKCLSRKKYLQIL